MGLDMYLTRRIYIGGQWEHREVEGTVDIKYKGGEHIIDPKEISEIIITVANWRKANAIHGWFVRECQKGVDNCEEYYVAREQLNELRDLCKEVLKSKNKDLLPPQEGFFFGNTDDDEWYFRDIEDTIKNLKDLPADDDYYYHSSW